MHDTSKSNPKWNKQYVQSVFIYHAMNNPEINLMDYPAYFQQELGIGDNRSFAKKLIRNGLAELTKQGGIRITKAGEQACDQEDVEFFQFACPHVTIADYRIRKSEMAENSSFEQVMFSLLYKKIGELFQKKEIKIVGDLCLEVAMLSERMEKYERAAQYYVKTLYYDLKGAEYSSLIADVEKGRCPRWEAVRRFDTIYIRSQVITGLQRLKECAIDKYVEDALNRKMLYYSYCKPEQFPHLVDEIVNGTYIEGNWRSHYIQRHRFKVALAAKKHQNK